MTTNPTPLLVGKADVVGGNEGISIRVLRDGQADGFDTGPVRLSAQNSFAVPLALRKGELNVFRIEAARGGAPLTASPSRFSILHGMSVAKPPLSQSVGVMLADNSVCWYLRKGAVLPTRNTVTHATTVPLKRGESGDAIKVPLVQGESDRADRNKIIGVLCIHAHHIARDLPVGTEIEVTLSVDEFSRTEARGYVPLLDRWFDEIVQFEAEEKSAEQVNTGLNEQQERLKLLEKQAAELEIAGAKAASPLDERIREVEALIAEGDRDSVELADQMVRLMTRQIDRVESETKTEGVKAKFEKLATDARELLENSGRKDELAALRLEFASAMERGDLAVAEVKTLLSTTSRSRPGGRRLITGWACSSISMAGSRSSTCWLWLVPGSIKGYRAANRGATQEVADVCMELINLLPREERGKMDVPVGALCLTSNESS